jgi:hypothetical protein
VDPKTLGWKHSREIFENVLENLGIVFYSTQKFLEMVLYCWKWRKRRWWFL